MNPSCKVICGTKSCTYLIKFTVYEIKKFNREVPSSNLLAAAVVPLGKVLYHHLNDSFIK